VVEQQASNAEEFDVGATRTCHNVRYPVVMEGKRTLRKPHAISSIYWFEKTLAPDGKPTK
jgi:hypothetical protein